MIMDSVKSLFFQQESLKMLFEKWGVSDESTIIPWSNGYALTDKAGNITNYLTIDPNGQMLFQDEGFSTIGSVSSVANNQYQVYDNQQLIGHLFDSHHTGNLDAFLDMSYNGPAETLSSVLEIDVDSVDTILNISKIVDFY